MPAMRARVIALAVLPLLVASSAAAQTAQDTNAANELAQRCASEAERAGMQAARVRGECLQRLKLEAAEAKEIMAKIPRWQPRGYDGAGEGLEAFTEERLATAVDDMRAAVARLNDLMLDLAGRPVMSDEQLKAASAELSRFVVSERACRTNPKCMAERAARKAEEEFFAATVLPMCNADQAREGALADIAREKANPSGVVDLNLLHDDGVQVQESQRQIAALAPAYVKVRHHPWRGWRTECHGPANPASP